ncbi:MAG: 16S rRNA (uracil(1498)-N(3))-methyltransferase [Phycisphaera sp.]|nr:MAG: 16S rRNA (uracil(1498)-N(3))-methyltransferase [Phycisphaera sp.]
MHRIFYQFEGATPAPGDEVRIIGEEARHALRVKRLETGHRLEVIDGSGTLAHASVLGSEKLGKRDGWALLLTVESVLEAPRDIPHIDVRSAVPKGPRLESMVDALSQVGAATWGPLISERAVVDPREGKLSRLERVVEESAKQCGRAWLMEIAPRTFIDDLQGLGEHLVVADASGEPYKPTGSNFITLAVGPEGGWSQSELDKLRQSGARVCAFGTHVMRIETAVVSACAIMLDAEQRDRVVPGTPGREDTP